MTAVSDAGLAGLADTVLKLAAKLDIRSPALRDVIPLTGTEIAVMREIHQLDRPSPSQIADATGLQRSNVSTALRNLEARGLVVRQHSAGDARAIELIATPLAGEILQRIHDYWVTRLRALPPTLQAEGVAAVDVLARIASVLSEQGA
ncbi:MarR family transcriptional regulator [Nocardioides sp.]|uniref:MarR family winged helix-turn-helix transcriptional regulator n=1 Tax=Nocardioides sp. TaxID=35761 RepID=UPI00263846A5|nr:MarR family transcriptional regulator [Nocardioides sp.]